VAIDTHHLGDHGMRESAGVPSVVLLFVLIGAIVIFAVGGIVAFDSSTNLIWPAQDTLTIPLGS